MCYVRCTYIQRRMAGYRGGRLAATESSSVPGVPHINSLFIVQIPLTPRNTPE